MPSFFTWGARAHIGSKLKMAKCFLLNNLCLCSAGVKGYSCASPLSHPICRIWLRSVAWEAYWVSNLQKMVVLKRRLFKSWGLFPTDCPDSTLVNVSAKPLHPDYVGGRALSLELRFNISNASLLRNYIWQQDLPGYSFQIVLELLFCV